MQRENLELTTAFINLNNSLVSAFPFVIRHSMFDIRFFLVDEYLLSFSAEKSALRKCRRNTTASSLPSASHLELVSACQIYTIAYSRPFPSSFGVRRSTFVINWMSNFELRITNFEQCYQLTYFQKKMRTQPYLKSPLHLTKPNIFYIISSYICCTSAAESARLKSRTSSRSPVR